MFHVNLKSKRLHNNLSQKQVADFLKISHQSVSKWENGDALPSIEYLPKLAECLNCNIDDFFAKEESAAFEYMVLNDYFSLMSELFYENKTVEDVINFVQLTPDVLEKARAFCDNLMENKKIQSKYIQNAFNCSVDEAKMLLLHLESCEMIEKTEDDNSYIVVHHAVEGMLPLIRLYGIMSDLYATKNCEVKNCTVSFSTT